MPPHLSPAAQDFIRAALRMDPQERPSAAELLQHPFVAAYAALPPPAADAAAAADEVADEVAAPATPQPLLAAGHGCSPARSSPARGSPGRLAPRGSPCVGGLLASTTHARVEGIARDNGRGCNSRQVAADMARSRAARSLFSRYLLERRDLRAWAASN